MQARLASPNFRFVPLTRWIGDKTFTQKHSPYRAGYADTLNYLEKELKHLSAQNITIEAGFRSSEIRNDGWPRSSARPQEPGVIISFTSKYGAIALSCDYFRDWEDNMRAIAYHLEHLRMAGLRGVGKHGEQYKGWAQLPPKAPAMSNWKHAVDFINEHSGKTFPVEDIANTPSLRDRAYRQAAAKLHPDNKLTGNEQLFKILQEAITILRRDDP